MRKVYLLLFLLAISFNKTWAQVSVSGSAANDGVYTSLTNAGGAFSALNGTNQSGRNITITITGDLTSESGNNSLSGTAGMWNSLIIKPVGARIIRKSSAGYLLDLNQADNVTIDGLNDGTNSLIIENISTANATAAIRFINEATYNVVKNCTIRGSAESSGVGVIHFSTSSPGSIGNSFNRIENCDITYAGTRSPFNGINSTGLSSATNKNDTIQNCRIYDIFNDTATTRCIRISSNSSGWVINSNKIYQTTAKNFSKSGNNISYSAIDIDQTNGGSGFLITNNIIGFASSLSTGVTDIGSTNTFANEFRGIYFNAVAGTDNTISYNTIAGISFTTVRGATSGSVGFVAIEIAGGSAAVSNNVIGSQNTNSSISLTTKVSNSGSLLPFAAIQYSSNLGSTISNNSIGGITLVSATTYGENLGFSAIRLLSSSSITVSNNLIGGTVSNSISSSTTNGMLVGLYIESGSVTASSNTIRNLNCDGSNSQLFGLLLNGGTGTYSFSNNTINDLTTLSIRNHQIHNNTDNAYANSSLVGIDLKPGSGSGSISVVGNTIFNLKNNNTGTTNYPSVIGIETDATTTTGNNISANRIYGLENKQDKTAGQPNSSIVGIRAYDGKWIFQNNMISLSNGANTNSCWVYGIQEGAGTVAAATSAYYYNSVYIGGTLGTSNPFSAALNIYAAGSSTDIFRNNIFINNRINAGGTGTHYAIEVYPNSTPNYDGKFNILYAANDVTKTCRSGNGTNLTFAGWQALGASFDPGISGTGSFSSSVAFEDPSTGDLHITAAASILTIQNKAVSLAGIIDTDYDGQLRKPNCGGTDIGADEVYINSSPSSYNLWTGKSDTKWCEPCNWDNETVPTTTDNVVIQTTASGNYPLLNTAAGCDTAYCKDLTISSGSVTMQAGGSLSIYGNFTNSDSFTATGGDVNFMGSSTQTISSSSPLSFYNLSFDGGGSKQLTTTSTVTGTLHLTNGKVTVAAGNYLALAAGSGYTGGSSNSFVEGTFRKIFSSTENGSDFKFPIGSSTHYGPVGIVGISGVSDNEYMEASYTIGVAPGDHRTIFSPVPAAPSGSTEKVDFSSYVEYWNLSFSNPGSLAFSAKTRLYYTNNNFSQLYNRGADWLRVMWYDAGNNGYLDIGNDNPKRDESSGADYYITSSNPIGASLFNSIFTFGTTANGVNPLPALIRSFSVSKQNGYNKLQWNIGCTGKELNFTILRSVDGKYFQSIHSFTASQERCNQPFDFNDYTNATGAKTYYRIKITNELGKVMYTQVAVVTNSNKDMEIVGILPNPTTDWIYLTINATATGPLQLIVTDITGKQVMNRSSVVKTGLNQLPLSVKKLPGGMYNISGIYRDGRISTVRFIKQ